MFEITTETSFSAAHRLKNYQGPCENLHGHNWLVKATVRCAELDVAGIGIDFKVLKHHLKTIVNQFDHKDLNEVLEVNPSSENIARFIFGQLKAVLANSKAMVVRIEVQETPGNAAVYYE